jgi:hypothetical protein
MTFFPRWGVDDDRLQKSSRTRRDHQQSLCPLIFPTRAESFAPVLAPGRGALPHHVTTLATRRGSRCDERCIRRRNTLRPFGFALLTDFHESVASTKPWQLCVNVRRQTLSGEKSTAAGRLGPCREGARW